MLKKNNTCMVCGRVLHPKWWTNFGFHEQNEELQALTTIMCLDEEKEELKNALTLEVGSSSMPSEFHGLVHVIFTNYENCMIVLLVRLSR
jgi:hypothetical protein